MLLDPVLKFPGEPRLMEPVSFRLHLKTFPRVLIDFSVTDGIRSSPYLESLSPFLSSRPGFWRFKTHTRPQYKLL